MRGANSEVHFCSHPAEQLTIGAFHPHWRFFSLPQQFVSYNKSNTSLGFQRTDEKYTILGLVFLIYFSCSRMICISCNTISYIFCFWDVFVDSCPLNAVPAVTIYIQFCSNYPPTEVNIDILFSLLLYFSSECLSPLLWYDCYSISFNVSQERSTLLTHLQ